jgi:protein O-mannosyl-transferase
MKAGNLRTYFPAMLAVALAAALGYTRTLGHDLVWDDVPLLRRIAEHFAARGMTGVLTAEFDFPTMPALGYYRPIVLLSLWVDSLLAPHFPGVYHFTNVVLHVAAALLTTRVVTRVAGSAPAGLVGGLLFALHPVHVESVAFVSGRTDILACVFSLASVLAWLGSRDLQARSTAAQMTGGAAAFTLALLSKEVSFLLPAILLGWDAVLPRRGENRGWWRRNRSWLAVWAACIVAVLLLRYLVIGVPLGRSGASPPGIGPPVLLVPAVLLFYLRLLCVPWPLSSYYTADALRFGAWVLFSLPLLALCLATARGRDGRTGILGLFWIVGFLVPVLGIVPIQGPVMAERYLYLPSVGYALVAGQALGRLLESHRLRLAAAGFTGLILLLFGVATVSQVGIWKDELTLFTDATRTAPRYAGGHYNLGNVLRRAGRYEEALQAYERAVRLDPNFPDALNNYGCALLTLGRFREAVAPYRAALRLSPNREDIRSNLNMALQMTGEPGIKTQGHRPP